MSNKNRDTKPLEGETNGIDLNAHWLCNDCPAYYVNKPEDCAHCGGTSFSAPVKEQYTERVDAYIDGYIDGLARERSKHTPPPSSTTIEALAEKYLISLPEYKDQDFNIQLVFNTFIAAYTLRDKEHVSAVTVLENEIIRLQQLLEISGQPY